VDSYAAKQMETVSFRARVSQLREKSERPRRVRFFVRDLRIFSPSRRFRRVLRGGKQPSHFPPVKDLHDSFCLSTASLMDVGRRAQINRRLLAGDRRSKNTPWRRGVHLVLELVKWGLPMIIVRGSSASLRRMVWLVIGTLGRTVESSDE
jgi:hypothetical protein